MAEIIGEPRSDGAPFYRDRFFWAAVFAPLLFWGGLWLTTSTPAISGSRFLSWKFFFLAFAQPIIEELLFRGFLQGELLQFGWGKERWGGITAANIAASLLFVLGHFISHPPLWAASVFVPSLIFGYFRDRSSSLIPSIILHCYYNAGYFILAGLP